LLLPNLRTVRADLPHTALQSVVILIGIGSPEPEPPVGRRARVQRKRHVADGIAYLEELRAVVLKGLKAGKSVDELKQSIKMKKYRTWASYDNWRELNVQGMARYLVESGQAQ